MSAVLASRDELPADYTDALRARHLEPLWPSLRSLLPPHRPVARTLPMAWLYEALRPLLLRAGTLTPIERAERRVLVLANPGHGPDSVQASAAIYLGMQLLLPGEWAPAHRHTPSAVRLIVEGHGAHTTVNGEKCTMEPGDLILTPSGQWHEHGHAGDAPVIWLDVLDLPLMHYLEASWHEDGTRQEVTPRHGEPRYARGGLVPTHGFEREDAAAPLLRFAWRDTRAALLALAAQDSRAEWVQLGFVNPENGAPVQRVLGYHAQMLRPGQSLALPVRSPAMVLHVIEGGVEMRIDAQSFVLDPADTACAPGYAAVTLTNRSPREPAFLFIADEAPLHRALGVHDIRRS